MFAQTKKCIGLAFDAEAEQWKKAMEVVTGDNHSDKSTYGTLTLSEVGQMTEDQRIHCILATALQKHFKQ